MSSSKGVRGVTVSHVIIRVAFAPNTEGTLVTVSRSRTGSSAGRSDRLAYWWLADSIESFSGLATHDVLLRLFNGLLRGLESGSDSFDRGPSAVGPGAPLGATGGTVGQDPLPGM